MNRFAALLTLFAGLLALLLVAVWFFLRPTSPSQQSIQQNNIVTPPNSYTVQSNTQNTSPQADTQNTSPQAIAVQETFKHQIPATSTENIKLYETSVADNYALQVWVGVNTGGEALLKYDPIQAVWSVITWGGGAWNVADLVAAGVPTTTAATLLAGVPH